MCNFFVSFLIKSYYFKFIIIIIIIIIVNSTSAGSLVSQLRHRQRAKSNESNIYMRI